MSDHKKLFEAYLEDSKIKIDIITTNEKGLPCLLYALKLLEIEITRRIGENVKEERPELQIASPNEVDLIMNRIKQ